MLTGLGRRMLAADADRCNEWLAQRLTSLTQKNRNVLAWAAALMAALAEN